MTRTTGSPRKISVYAIPKSRNGNSAGLRVSRHSAIPRPTIAIKGADHAKIITFKTKASSKPENVAAKTRPLKKDRCTASHPGANGTRSTTAKTTPIVEISAMRLDRRRTLAS